MYHGQIKMIDPIKRYCFVSRDDGKGDVYIPLEGLRVFKEGRESKPIFREGGRNPCVGDRVVFPDITDRGRGPRSNVWGFENEYDPESTPVSISPVDDTDGREALGEHRSPARNRRHSDDPFWWKRYY